MTTNRVAILGVPVSSQNRGVLALASSLVNLCLELSSEAEVVLMPGHSNNLPVPFRVAGKTVLISVVNSRLSPRSRPCDHIGWIILAAMLYRSLPVRGMRRAISKATPWIATLERADVAGDIRGGDSFSDIYGMRRFLLGFLGAWTVILVKGTMVQFPQTFGPYDSWLARWLAKYLLSKSRIVIARDKMSRQIAQRLMGPSREVWLSPDVAFSLEAVRPERVELFPPLKDGIPTCVIGLNVNGLMANGGYSRDNMFGLVMDYRSLLPELVKSLLAEHPGELWLVPHTYGPPDSVESDPEACRQLREALPKMLQSRVRIVTGEYDQHEIKGVIGMCDFFIGSRMHACIAAMSQGIPCVGIAYSLKFAGVFESVGMLDWVVDGRSMNNSQAILYILDRYRKRDGVRESLAANADDARERLRDVFRRFFESCAP